MREPECCGPAARCRQIDRLIGEAGFSLDRLETRYLSGPKPLGYIFEGIAAKP